VQDRRHFKAAFSMAIDRVIADIALTFTVPNALIAAKH